MLLCYFDLYYVFCHVFNRELLFDVTLCATGSNKAFHLKDVNKEMLTQVVLCFGHLFNNNFEIHTKIFINSQQM